MRPALALVVLLAASPARADESLGQVTAQARVVKLDVRQAARLLATAYGLSVIVVGGQADEVSLDLGAADPRAALEKLARAAGLEVAAEGRLLVVGPHDAVTRVRGAGRGPAGRSATFDFLDVDAAGLMRIIGEVNRRTVEGKLAGAIAITVRHLDSLTVARVIARLAGAELRTTKSTLAATGLMPASSRLDAPACDPPPNGDVQPQQLFGRHALHCLAIADLEVAAIAWRGHGSLAAVRGRADGRRLAEIVRSGDAVGEPHRRIESIEPDAIVLETGDRLPLARR